MWPDALLAAMRPFPSMPAIVDAVMMAGAIETERDAIAA
jgi:hypothetical protein